MLSTELRPALAPVARGTCRLYLEIDSPAPEPRGRATTRVYRMRPIPCRGENGVISRYRLTQVQPKPVDEDAQILVDLTFHGYNCSCSRDLAGRECEHVRALRACGIF